MSAVQCTQPGILFSEISLVFGKDFTLRDVPGTKVLTLARSSPRPPIYPSTAYNWDIIFPQIPNPLLLLSLKKI